MMNTFFRNFLAIIAVSIVVVATAVGQRRDYPIRPIELPHARIMGKFWHARMETNRTVTIPFVFRQIEETGDIKNFEIAAKITQGEQCGVYPFNDTNPYKSIEGASYSLMLHPDTSLERYLDRLIEKISMAQEEDGYLYTARTNNARKLIGRMGSERWSRLQGSHELYNAGHLYEAAVAHYQATGKRSLLAVALKNAELIDRVFGPGKKRIPPGHQEIEIGLVKLYRASGDERFLRLAKFFLDQRGYANDGRRLWGEYAQDHKPVIDQDEAVGHAVRAGYMYAAMADIGVLTGDHRYIQAIDKIWKNVVGKKLYLTGGVGAQGFGEGFAGNYELPNMSAYNETCASIANILWNHRMFLIHGDGKYVDVLERTLYNAFLSSVSTTGDRFFYANPLASRGQNWRTPWFDCACCPPNIVRLIASLPRYLYAQSGDTIYVNLFAESEAHIIFPSASVDLRQTTNYPWDGSVTLSVHPSRTSDFSLFVRIPGWARNEPVPSDLYRYSEPSNAEVELRVNGKPWNVRVERGYVSVHRSWKKGDIVELRLPMPIHRVVAHPQVEADTGMVALERGPLVYCAEWPDNNHGHVLHLVLPDNVPLIAEHRSELVNGVTVIKGKAFGIRLGEDKKSLLKDAQDFTAIPYYAWAHRGPGEMTVWLAKDAARAKPLFSPSLASTGCTSSSGGNGLQALNDEIEPRNSDDSAQGYFVWSPRRDTVWVEYDFGTMEEVSEVQVYWFDNSESPGNCRVPTSWRILAFVDNRWQAVWAPTMKNWDVERNKFNRVYFETARTSAVRLEATPQPGYTAGIIEWRVY